MYCMQALLCMMFTTVVTLTGCHLHWTKHTTNTVGIVTGKILDMWYLAMKSLSPYQKGNDCGIFTQFTSVMVSGYSDQIPGLCNKQIMTELSRCVIHDVFHLLVHKTVDCQVWSQMLVHCDWEPGRNMHWLWVLNQKFTWSPFTINLKAFFN